MTLRYPLLAATMIGGLSTAALVAASAAVAEPAPLRPDQAEFRGVIQSLHQVGLFAARVGISFDQFGQEIAPFVNRRHDRPFIEPMRAIAIGIAVQSRRTV